MEELNEFKRLISISYGEDDKFTLHCYNIKEAQNVLFETFRILVGFQYYVNLHKEFLLNKGVYQNHIEEQIKYIKGLVQYLQKINLKKTIFYVKFCRCTELILYI